MPYKDPEKQREFQRRWTASRREDFFKDKSCVRCGSQKRLELDHVDPKLKVSHNIWSWSEKRRLEEIEKCQVLCRNCHQMKTREDMNWGQVHGTTNSYNNYGCRCVECTKAAVDKSREFRKRGAAPQ